MSKTLKRKMLIPDKIDDAKVICFAFLGELHPPPIPSSRHVILPPPVRGLAICQYEDNNCDSFYLFYCDEKWNTLNDTWHESVQKAKEQAEFEYEGISQLWIDKLKAGYRLYSPKLMGVQGAECWGPKCNAPVVSTGWLEFDFSSQPSWHMEFSCSSHGLIMAFVANLAPIVIQVLKENGFQHET